MFDGLAIALGMDNKAEMFLSELYGKVINDTLIGEERFLVAQILKTIALDKDIQARVVFVSELKVEVPGLDTRIDF